MAEEEGRSKIRSKPKTGKIYFGALLAILGYAIHYLYGPAANQCRSTLGQVEQAVSNSAQQSCSSAQLLSLASVALMLFGGVLVLVGIILALKWRASD